MRRGKKKAKRVHKPVKRTPVDRRRLREMGGLGMVAIALFLALIVYLGLDAGAAGTALEEGLRYLAGRLIYLVPPLVAAVGVLLIFPELLRGYRGLEVGLGMLVAALFLIAGSNLLSLFGVDPADKPFFDSAYFTTRGGIIGATLYWLTAALVGDVGSTVVIMFLLLASGFLITGASVRTVLLASGRGARRAASRTARTARQAQGAITEKISEGGGGKTERLEKAAALFGVDPAAADERPVIGDNTVIRSDIEDGTPLDGASTYPDIFALDRPPMALVEEPAEPAGPQDELFDEEESVRAVQEQLFEEPAADKAPAYVLPTTDFLKKSQSGGGSSAEHAERISRVLVETLASFGIEARVVGIDFGPRLDRYELQLAPGIKVSKVSNLKNDIAYALATTDIRILAPIPGKSAVGVEVPNSSANLVTLGDIYRDFPAGAGPLSVWLGKDIAGKPVYADLAKMPHLLVAGTTGSGKSGCINCILSSVLLRSSPEDVRMVLVDPKRVELNHFEGIPHLLTPVVTVMKEAANVLGNLVEEMESRYAQMQLVKARKLEELNRVLEARGQQPLPFILLVVDELADLMMVAPGEVEDAIIRLAQKSRAVGIHLVLATQRPSVDVITGMIKANVPSRIAFAVSSQVDSRVILDTNGAESLLGQGDMLFSPLGSSQLQRVQGAYISEGEIKLLTDACRLQRRPDFNFELLEGKGEDEDEKLAPDEDELLPEAAEMVVTSGTASVSFLQRRLRVGYSRAGRLIDMLERRGIISGYEGSKPRRVLVGEEELERVLAALKRRSDNEAATDEMPSENETSAEVKKPGTRNPKLETY